LCSVSSRATFSAVSFVSLIVHLFTEYLYYTLNCVDLDSVTIF
jgi:hypothetical protein